MGRKAEDGGSDKAGRCWWREYAQRERQAEGRHVTTPNTAIGLYSSDDHLLQVTILWFPVMFLYFYIRPLLHF
ncbi:hypothetical protein Pcinc_042909 [Petrolisthes cinctipes]|uniref:Uncharacterized protein n=1 Tax=Petrolisthes cinctipes TaxID=88211 RepID=A0AAE1BGZ0_PETCI|nr:hypothetical protein Pcinc_042909 [Petrolisthes cinctipes]